MTEEERALLTRTAERIADHHDAAAAPVFPPVDAPAVRTALGGPLPDAPTDPSAVIDQLVAAVEPILVASTGPRYFGFVIGGTLEAATCADLLATGWDQNAFNSVTSPAGSIVEEIAGEWLKDLLGLPASASIAPVRLSARLITRTAATVITAGLLNPPKAASGATSPSRTQLIRLAIATTS